MLLPVLGLGWIIVCVTVIPAMKWCLRKMGQDKEWNAKCYRYRSMYLDDAHVDYGVKPVKTVFAPWDPHYWDEINAKLAQEKADRKAMKRWDKELKRPSLQ